MATESDSFKNEKMMGKIIICSLQWISVILTRREKKKDLCFLEEWLRTKQSDTACGFGLDTGADKL